MRFPRTSLLIRKKTGEKFANENGEEKRKRSPDCGFFLITDTNFEMWFDGPIGTAIATAKTEKRLLIIYVHGKFFLLATYFAMFDLC